MRRRAFSFPLPAAAATPTSSASARSATTGPPRRIRTIPATRGTCTSIRAISTGTTSTATASAGGLFVQCEDLPSSARRMRRRAQLGGKPRRRRARRALKRPRARIRFILIHSIHFAWHRTNREKMVWRPVGRGFQPRRPGWDGAPGVRSRPDVAFAR